MTRTQDDIKHKKLNVAKVSLYAAFGIVFIKLLASVFSGSIGILSELFHSGTDLVATVATIMSIRFSNKPPDHNHHYGHEKIESFSALFQVIILILMCAYLIYESIDRIINPVAVNLSVWIFAAILLCIYIDWHRSRALMRVAKETNSQALEADSLHFSSDILSSFVVLIGMVFTKFNIWHYADPVSAIIVSIIIIYTTFNLSKRAISALLDTVPDGLQENINNAVLSVKGIEGIKSLRIRGNGNNIFIDMIILIGRTKSFSLTHEIMDNAEKEIKHIAPQADIVIHSEPVETKEETLNEKIRLVVTDKGFKCHDIFSHKIKNEIFSELHVEIENTNDLIKAHEIITELENEIITKIPLINKVKIHLDEPSEILFDTIDITETSQDLIYNVRKIIEKENNVADFNDIKIVNSLGKIRVSLNCSFRSSLSFENVHDTVTLLESKIYLNLKEVYPNISNVIIHAEPL